MVYRLVTPFKIANINFLAVFRLGPICFKIFSLSFAYLVIFLIFILCYLARYNIITILEFTQSISIQFLSIMLVLTSLNMFCKPNISE